MQKSNVWLASALIHQRVRNSIGEDLGKVEDVVVDPASGNIQYAILSFGGVFGMGNRRVPIPLSLLSVSPSRDYAILDIDKETLKRAPSFEQDAWPNMADPAWRQSIHDYYRVEPLPVARVEPLPVAERPVAERRVYVEHRPVPARRGMSLLAGILLVCLIVGLGWMTFLVATRGWDQAQQDLKSSLQSAAYAAKETSHDAAITTKVKTALSLSKRIPADQINVDSEGDVVTLRGDVPSEQIRDLAGSIASDVPGVSEVHNHLFAIKQSQ